MLSCMFTFGVNWDKLYREAVADTERLRKTSFQPRDRFNPVDVLDACDARLHALKSHLSIVARLDVALGNGDELLGVLRSAAVGDKLAQGKASFELKKAALAVRSIIGTLEKERFRLRLLCSSAVRWIDEKKQILADLELAKRRLSEVASPELFAKEKLNWLVNPAFHVVAKLFWIDHPRRVEWINSYISMLNELMMGDGEHEIRLHLLETEIDVAVDREIEKLQPKQVSSVPEFVKELSDKDLVIDDTVGIP